MRGAASKRGRPNVLASRSAQSGTALGSPGLSLALFVGIAVGTYSSIFIATPVLADLREREATMQQQKKHADRYQAGQARQAASAPAGSGPDAHDAPDIQDRAAVTAGTGASATGRPLHPSVQTGPRNQPKRPPKSKR